MTQCCHVIPKIAKIINWNKCFIGVFHPFRVYRDCIQIFDDYFYFREKFVKLVNIRINYYMYIRKEMTYTYILN